MTTGTAGAVGGGQASAGADPGAPAVRRLRVVDLGLACCGVAASAALSGEDPRPPWVPPAPVRRQADDELLVLVVAGTVTGAMARRLVAFYESLEPPTAVIAFGACATSGGPYWDSYSVVAGVERLIPVDLFVPGCPPDPGALTEALRRLAEAGPT